MQILVCEDDRIYQKSIKKKIEQWITTTHHEEIRIIIFLLLRICWRNGRKG